MNRLYLIACLLIFSTSQSHAEPDRQRDYKGGLKHTYVRQAEPAPAPTAKTEATEQSVKTEKTSALPENPADEKVSDKPAVEVWKKYKAMSGLQKDEEKAEEAKNEDAPDAPEKPDLPEIAKAKEKLKERRDNREAAAPQATGFAAIINDYRINKERRSQIKSIQINKPDTPEVKKPTVEN